MSGLNDGLELDDVVDTSQPKEDQLAELVFESTQDGQTPELDENVTVIASLSKKHDRIEDTQDRLIQQDSISQAVALEAHNLTENLLTDQYPIGMFTEFPTRTGLNYALESLDKEKKNILVRLYEKIKSYIVRALEWLGGLINRAPKATDEKAVEEFFGKYFTQNTSVVEGTLIVNKRKEEFFSRLNDILKRKGLEQGVLDSVQLFGQKVLEKFEKNDKSFENLRTKIAASPTMVAMINNSDYFKNLVKLNEFVGRFREGLVTITDQLTKADFEDSLKYTKETADEFTRGVATEVASMTAAIDAMDKDFARIFESKMGSKFANEAAGWTIEDFLEDCKYLHEATNLKNYRELRVSKLEFQSLKDEYTTLLKRMDDVIAGYEASIADTRGKGGDPAAIETLHASFRELFALLSRGSQSTMKYFHEVLSAQRAAGELKNAAVLFVKSSNGYVKSLIASLPEKARPEVTKYMEGVGFKLDATAE